MIGESAKWAGKPPGNLLPTSGTQPDPTMKTLTIILTTLVVSQFIYVECGPRNPVAHVAIATADSVRWLVDSMLPVLE